MGLIRYGHGHSANWLALINQLAMAGARVVVHNIARHVRWIPRRSRIWVVLVLLVGLLMELMLLWLLVELLDFVLGLLDLWASIVENRRDALFSRPS